MSTANIAITDAWTQVVAAAGRPGRSFTFLITAESPTHGH
jgi:hypothetical protein